MKTRLLCILPALVEMKTRLLCILLGVVFGFGSLAIRDYRLAATWDDVGNIIEQWDKEGFLNKQHYDGAALWHDAAADLRKDRLTSYFSREEIKRRKIHKEMGRFEAEVIKKLQDLQRRKL